MNQQYQAPGYFEQHVVLLCSRTGLSVPQLQSILHTMPDTELRRYRSMALAGVWHPYNDQQGASWRPAEVSPVIRSAFEQAYVATYCIVFELVPSDLASLPLPSAIASLSAQAPPSLDELIHALTELWALERWGRT